MNKTGWFIASFCAWLMSFAILGSIIQPTQTTPDTPPAPFVQPPAPQIQPPAPPSPVEPDCVGVQVPIPKACRVYNKSGSQCVWCSIECLCRYHGIKDVFEGDSRITKHYTWATGPGEVSRVLTSRYSTLKWRQIQNRSQMKAFIKEYVSEKKFGVGIGIPGHMLNLVHYDEAAGIVKVIDNGGPKALQIQDWSMDKFNRLADGWVLTVFPPGHTEPPTADFLPEPNKLYGLDFRIKR